MDLALEIPRKFMLVPRNRMAKEKVLEFSCPIRIKLVLPKDCVLDEKALQERVESAGPQLFMGLCDACPHFQARDKR